MPVAVESESMGALNLADWKPVMAEKDVLENQINRASVQELRFILLKDAGDIFAYRDMCPHEQYPLSKGELSEGVIICARHLWEFEIRTGQHITRVPMVERNLLRYPVRIVNGQVEIDVSSPKRWGEQ